jgi:energy-coupling factor transporter ATP-binding protein EcfA2
MRLIVENFRSIRSEAIDLAPITVLYGPNAGGKSSLLYALACFRNIVVNPNQQTVGFFNLGSVNLGDFETVVFDHRKQEGILFCLEWSEEAAGLSYKVSIGQDRGRFEIHSGKPYDFAMSLGVTFPYPANQLTKHSFKVDGAEISIQWNGILAQSAAPPQSVQQTGVELLERLNSRAEVLRNVTLVPLVRGFFKPQYSPVPPTPTMLNEDQVATYLATNRWALYEVSRHLEKILGRQLQYYAAPGTALFTLDSIDRESGAACALVNDGFGVNQVAYLLAYLVQREQRIVCFEEPEIHLHPSAVRNLAAVLAELAMKEHKRFVFSTHSEALVWAFLAIVKRGQLSPDDLACYFVRKDGKESRFERQAVNAAGQIEGGLRDFVKAELQDLSELLGVAPEDAEGEDAKPAVRSE